MEMQASRGFDLCALRVVALAVLAWMWWWCAGDVVGSHWVASKSAVRPSINTSKPARGLRQLLMNSKLGGTRPAILPDMLSERLSIDVSLSRLRARSFSPPRARELPRIVACGEMVTSRSPRPCVSMLVSLVRETGQLLGMHMSSKTSSWPRSCC